MIQGAPYLFCLQDKNYNFYRWAADGSVTITSQPYFIQFSPQGWDDIAIQNVRNKRYWGIDRSVSVPLSYLKDGATILKHIFYNFGSEASVYLVIASQQLYYEAGVGYGFWYKKLYRAEVDLSTFNHASAKVTLTTLEDGLPKYLRANEATTQEYPMNVPEAIMVKMDGIDLHERANYQGINEMEVARAFYGTRFRMPTSFINNEGDSVGIVMQSQQLQNTTGMSFEDSQLLDNYIFKNYNSYPVTLQITGTEELICTDMVSEPPYAFRSRFLTSQTDISNQNDYQVEFAVLSAGVYSTGAMAVGQKYTGTIDITVTVPPNTSLFYEGIFFGGPGSDVKIEFTTNSKLKIEFISRHEVSYIRALRGQYLIGLLVASITESSYQAAVSNYLAQYNDIVFTSGNALRGLDDATIKLSWNDFFNFWDCFDSVGITLQNKQILLARKEDMVDAANAVDMGSPAIDSLKITMAQEYLFNELEIGYPELSNEIGVINGKQEFNTKFIFSVGATKRPAKLEKVSPIKASCYAIEKIRITTFEKDTTDYKADNEVFVLHVESELQPAVDDIPAHYRLNRDLNTGVTAGLIEPETVFNLFLSPKRNFIRNGSFIRSCFYKSDTLTFKFKSAANNSELVCDGVAEKADVNVGSLPAQFFVPILMSADFDVPENILDLLDENPIQVFKMTVKGTDFKGIMIKSGIAPSTKKLQSTEQLALASNDFTKLINYNG